MKKFKEGDTIVSTKKGILNGIHGTIISFSNDNKIASVDFGASGKWFLNRDNMENISDEKSELKKDKLKISKK